MSQSKRPAPSRKRARDNGAAIVPFTAGPRRRRAAPKKGRPFAAKASEVDDRIIEAATECFLAKGFDATTMDAIAASARVSKMTLYGRYPDKESLLRAVAEARFEAWSKLSSTLDWSIGDTLKERLEHRITIAMTWAVSPEIRAFDRLLATAPSSISRPLYAVRYGSFPDLIAKEIEEFTAAEGNPAKDPKQVAMNLMALLTGWFRMESAVRDVNKRRAIEFGLHAVDFVLAARAKW